MGSRAQSLPDRVVLAVDDQPVVCRLLARILEDAGFRVLEAHGGEEAADLLALNRAVELVVSDISMPGMGGEALAVEIAVRWPAVHVLLISGQGGPDAAYAGAFLPKPFTPDALVAAVATLVPLPNR